MQNPRNDSPAKRAVALVLAMLLAIGAAFAIAGCSASDEQVIRDGITEQLDMFKNPTKENLAPLVEKVDPAKLELFDNYGIDFYEFFEHAFGKFDYNVGDITVDGNTAVADVTVTSINVNSVIADVADKAKSDKKISAEIQKIAESGDQAKVMQYVIGLMYDAMDATTDVVTTDMKIKLVKEGNVWDFDDESLAELTNSIYSSVAQ